MQDHSLMYGSLVLAVSTPVQEFPKLVNPNTVKGFHMENRFKGAYSLLIDGDFEEQVVPLPTRNKYLTVTAVGDPSITPSLVESCALKLQEIDSLFEGARHLFKMQKLMDDLNTEYTTTNPEYLICINNSSTHSYFTLLTQGLSIHVYGVYDTVNKSVRIVWTNDDQFIASCRSVEPTRYVFYRFPLLENRPLFLYTQNLCARWYDWNKIFTGPDGILKAFNTTEILLYKNSNVETFQYQAPDQQQKTLGQQQVK